MKKIPLLIALCCCTVLAYTQSTNVQTFVNQAREAYKGGDFPNFYAGMLEAHKLNPYHQGILYQTGVAAALNNKPEEAIGYLTRAIRINASYDLAIADLKSLEGRADFEKLRKLQTELQEKVVNSDTAFVVKDRLLHVESVAAGEREGVFYLGSIHKRKIIRTDQQGNTTDFTSAGQDGLTSVFGVKVDGKKKTLWACSSPMREMENFDSTAVSGVYQYDLKTKKLLARYTPEAKNDYVFGDLTIDPSGSVFVSEGKRNNIFYVNQKSGKLELFIKSPEFMSLQGITFSPDGRYMFIADYIKGVFRLNMKDKTLKLLDLQFEQSVKSIDGLSYYNNSLIAIQNLVFPMRVTQYFLNENQDGLKDFKIVDRGHPAFNEPTIGCVVKDSFYYVANSLWSGYDKERRIKSEDQLEDVVILKADLKKLK
jgi:hypothetical protein